MLETNPKRCFRSLGTGLRVPAKLFQLLKDTIQPRFQPYQPIHKITKSAMRTLSERSIVQKLMTTQLCYEKIGIIDVCDNDSL